MTWILNKKTTATFTPDANDVNFTYFAKGMEFPLVEDSSNPDMKKVTTGAGAVFYVPASDIEQV